MSETNKLFITTTLPYANGGPHIGHALELAVADVIARRARHTSIVLFNTGLDQHGAKIAKAAELSGFPSTMPAWAKTEVGKKLVDMIANQAGLSNVA